MKRSAFKVHPDRAGWIRTTISPVRERRDVTFGIMDVIMFLALVLGTVAAARFLIAT